MTDTTMYHTLLTDVLNVRKDHDEFKKGILIPLLSDVQKISKDKRREVTDDDFFTVLKSTIKNVNFVIEKTTGEAKEKAQRELAVLQAYLPPAPKPEAVAQEVKALKEQGLNKGLIIKALKTKFGATFDVSDLAKTL